MVSESKITFFSFAFFRRSLTSLENIGKSLDHRRKSSVKSVSFQISPQLSANLQKTSEYVRCWRTKRQRHRSMSIIRQLLSHRFSSEKLISTRSVVHTFSQNFVAINREPSFSLSRFPKVYSRAQTPLKESNRGFSSHSELECFRYTQAGSDVEEPIGRKCNCGRSSFLA